MTDARPTILVLRALGLGDFLTGLPALRGLAAAFPGHRLVLAAPAWIAPVAKLSGTVDEILEVAELEPIDPINVDIAANLHGRGPQSHRILTNLRPRRLIAFAHPDVPATKGFPRWEPEEHEVTRWCRMLGVFSIPCDPSRLDLPNPPPAPARDRGATIVHPGGKSLSRRWPEERWVEVVRHEVRSGRRVLLTGSSAERGLCLTIATAAGVPASDVRAGSTTLEQLVALVASAGRVVCPDTGVAHLATALRTPSVVLFGPTPPALWGPPPARNDHVAIWKGMRGDPLGNDRDPGMLAITVDEVIAALGSLSDRSLTPLAAG